MDLTFEKLVHDPNIQIIISALISAVITWRAIPVIRNICEMRNLLENPVKRSSHISPTPTFGGVGIFAGLSIGYFIWNFQDEGNLLHKVYLGLVVLFFLGLKDDLYALAPMKKLLSQVLVSVLVVIGSDLRISTFFGIFGVHDLNYFVSVLFTVLLFVAVINSFNLIDGIDGLSGGIGMIASILFGSWFIANEIWSMACLSFCLAASLLGFLRYNYSRTSKIFMGDTGSLIVGYLVALLALKFMEMNQTSNFSPGNNYVSAPVLTIAVLSVPIFDTLRVFGLRILKGRSPFKADRLHLHHLLVDNGFSHIATSFTLYIFTIVLTVFTYYLRAFFDNTALSLYVMSVFAIYLAICSRLEVRRFKRHKEKKTQEQVRNKSTKSLGLEGTISPN